MDNWIERPDLTLEQHRDLLIGRILGLEKQLANYRKEVEAWQWLREVGADVHRWNEGEWEVSVVYDRARWSHYGETFLEAVDTARRYYTTDSEEINDT